MVTPPADQPPSDELVAVVGGTGALGFGLALRLGRAGVGVRIGSRQAERAREAAERAAAQVDARFEGADNAAAAADCPIVVLCVPFRNQSETLTNLKGV